MSANPEISSQSTLEKKVIIEKVVQYFSGIGLNRCSVDKAAESKRLMENL